MVYAQLAVALHKRRHNNYVSFSLFIQDGELLKLKMSSKLVHS